MWGNVRRGEKANISPYKHKANYQFDSSFPYELAVMLILSDHKTLTSTRGHDGDPVPYMIYDSRKSQGSGLSYTEANGLKGPFVPDGSRLMGMLFDK